MSSYTIFSDIHPLPEQHHFYAYSLSGAHDGPANIPPTPLSIDTAPLDPQTALLHATAYEHALALLQQPANSCMNSAFLSQQTAREADATGQRFEAIDSAGPFLPPGYSYPPSIDFDGDDDAAAQASWGMYNLHNSGNNNSMGLPIATPTHGLKRHRSHQRTPSASTVASTGPASPFSHNTSYPHIANTEFAPADQAVSFSKNLPTPTQTPTDTSFITAAGGYIPSGVAHTPAAHLAMKAFSIDHHNLEDLPAEFPHSARHSMSSIGQDSPATPRSAVDELESRSLRMGSNDYRQVHPDVQLSRSESAAYQDELYNPANFAAPTSAAKAVSQYLSPPAARNLVNERLQTANIARAYSPTSAVSRERSPFRQGSPLAPADGWNSPRAAFGTAAGLRQQQKEQMDQAEYDQHARPTLQREPTKTISPKDAVLDYTGEDQPPLFHDTIPAGYRQHFGGAEQYPNNFLGQPSATYGNMPSSSQQHMASFRATSSADGYPATNFNYSPPTFQSQGQIPHNAFNTANYQQVPAMSTPTYPAGSMAEQTPEFPANLTSMESSMSDQGNIPSSQDNYSTPTRPTDTRANTGTYTCTYHGCTQRFDSHQNLQKHKRDFHRSQQHNREGISSGTGSISPLSTESPGPSSSGMTSADILARNSQAGPHKCTRINPSTGKPCNTVFSRPYDLTRHEDTIHNGRKQKVRCPYCREEKTFSRNDALTRHMRVVHPEIETFGKRGRRGE